MGTEPCCGSAGGCLPVTPAGRVGLLLRVTRALGTLHQEPAADSRRASSSAQGQCAPSRGSPDPELGLLFFRTKVGPSHPQLLALEEKGRGLAPAQPALTDDGRPCQGAHLSWMQAQLE